MRDVEVPLTQTLLAASASDKWWLQNQKTERGPVLCHAVVCFQSPRKKTARQVYTMEHLGTVDIGPLLVCVSTCLPGSVYCWGADANGFVHVIRKTRTFIIMHG